MTILSGGVYVGGNRASQAIGPVRMGPSTTFWVTNSSPVFGDAAQAFILAGKFVRLTRYGPLTLNHLVRLA